MYYHGFPTVDRWATMINLADNMMLPGYGEGDRKGKKAVEVRRQYSFLFFVFVFFPFSFTSPCRSCCSSCSFFYPLFLPTPFKYLFHTLFVRYSLLAFPPPLLSSTSFRERGKGGGEECVICLNDLKLTLTYNIRGLD